MKCPKCDLNQPATNLECPRCGVVFAKIGFTPSPDKAAPRREPSPPRQPEDTPAGPRPVGKGAADRAGTRTYPSRRKSAPPAPPAGRVSSAVVPPVPAHTQVGAPSPAGDEEAVELVRDSLVPEEEETIPEPRHLDARDWFVIATGAVIALACMYFFWTSHILSTLMILVHEMGHAMVGWLFAYPSLPAFDLRYGGGITVHTERWTQFLILIYLAIAMLIYLYRKNRWAVICLVAVALIHALLAFTSWHEALILFMGHGMELLIAAIFLFRAFSGSKVIHPIERPMYGIIGFYIVFADIAFAWGLMTSPAKRAMYGAAKGGGHWMDFSRLAYEHFEVNLPVVATFFFVCCLLPPLLAFLVFRYQEYLHHGISRLARRES